jgi:hypothetical protein
MHRLFLGVLLALLISTENVSANLVATLKGPGNVSTVQVPLAGGTYDISVNLTRDSGDPAFIGFQFNVKASAAGFATLNGINPSGGNPPGVAGNATTGTRYNDPEWDADLNTGLDPNKCAGPMSPAPQGPLGTGYSGVWTTASSLLGYLNVTVGPGSLGGTFVISPADYMVGVDTNFDDVPATGVGVAFQYVPEPGIALLMGIGLMVALSRKRRASR